MSSTMAGRPEVVKPGALQWVLGLGCLLLWAVKFWLTARLNINWDEFHFLSMVHAATRGELTQGFQTAFTHLFAWLPLAGSDEIAQIHIARTLMVLLLGASALMIQRLATRWFPPAAAWTAALAFLSMWPTLKHGGSFRADSLLLPLQLGALLVLTRPQSSDRIRGMGAGVLLGCATAISLKAVLLAPVVVALGIGMARDWRRGMRRLALLAVAAAITAAVLLGVHQLSLDGQGAAVGSAAQGAWQKTMRDLPWFPQARTLREMLYVDRAFWLVAAAGLGWALYRRLWPVAACALALLPVVFYRNSFVYFYVPMWAPACVLFAAAFAGVRELASRGARPMIASVASLSLAALLGAHGLRQLPYLAIPRQDEQRELVAAVHAIFPEPVAYIDHSGMIASFRKANLFMTSWAMQGYLDNGRPFMPTAIARFRPPLLIGNRGELIPGTRVYGRLLAEDRAIIESGYQPYWGNLRIAGAAATIDGSQPVALELPFGGRYRLESLQAVRIDGHLVEPGAVIEVSDDRLKVVASTSTTATSGEPLAMRLLWADARPPPPAPTSVDYYDGL